MEIILAQNFTLTLMILYSKIKIQKIIPEKKGLIIPAEYVPKFCILKKKIVIAQQSLIL